MIYMITGGAGFIGSAVADRILKDRLGEVVIVDRCAERRDRPYMKKNIERFRNQHCKVIVADCADMSAMRQIMISVSPNIIINCAGHGDVRDSHKIANICLSDTAGTATVIAQCATFPCVKKIVHISSAAVYGNTPAPFRENASVRIPVSMHGLMHKFAEDTIEIMGTLAGVKYTILRPFYVYGPEMRNSSFLSKCVECTESKNRLAVVHEATCQRDMVYIDDMVEAVILATGDWSVRSQSFNVCTGKAVPLGYIVRAVCEYIGTTLRMEPIALAADEQHACYGDPAKAKEIMGFSAQILPAVGIERYVRWKQTKGR